MGGNAGFGLRANTRHSFSRGFRQKGASLTWAQQALRRPLPQLRDAEAPVMAAVGPWLLAQGWGALLLLRLAACGAALASPLTPPCVQA